MEERRGRPATIHEEVPRKYTRIYEDGDVIETWTYDTDKFKNGPISVDIKYKNGIDKKWDKIQKEAKQIKKTERQMKKINEKNK